MDKATILDMGLQLLANLKNVNKQKDSIIVSGSLRKYDFEKLLTHTGFVLMLFLAYVINGEEKFETKNEDEIQKMNDDIFEKVEPYLKALQEKQIQLNKVIKQINLDK